MIDQTGCAAGAPPHILTSILPFERLLFASDLVCLGTFRTAPRDAGFHGGHPCTGHLVVFPRRAVWIQHEGGRPFVADPATVPVYNRGQVYRRAAIDPRGDECEWMAFPSEVLLSALRELDHRTQDSPDTPFDIVAARGSGELYAAQRRLFAAASAPGPTPGAPARRLVYAEGRAADLSDLALSAGFCSHSHFGAAFRREFGVTPSRLRGELIRRGN